ncbi:hypothetical protein BMETH_2068_0 [methanotrophic bacterial endosymbiont of Bathymodiolus sp.]|nr:hypothetical protein BMETH_2068_0 [methanotrophic bacterial endosymbiont of Bathymodiolus sp.]
MVLIYGFSSQKRSQPRTPDYWVLACLIRPWKSTPINHSNPTTDYFPTRILCPKVALAT